MPRWGPLNFASLIHDAAFQHRFELTHDRRVSRKYADMLLYSFARATGCNPFTAYAVRYAAQAVPAGRRDEVLALARRRYEYLGEFLAALEQADRNPRTQR